MPRFDMTGPMGRGSMTGRGMGYCARPAVPGTGRGVGFGMGMGRGFGFGRGAGFGRGFGRNRFWGYGPYPDTEEDDKAYLRDEVSFLEEELKAAKEALSKYESQED
ncbi:DUF5320 domain-containing protein [Gudongella oleilytica]|uniref:DUF5320 domain-containing protein n=1 Tax=Gudongella oleilytica TaxID=1582259 RepID=UPI002A359A1E|nr:DUF5320 domain-containing protein [Gudongella oleilytica]MDY0257318.1 DUF5320 domain-containing protein [Gudongella oleilytica]